MKKTKRVYKSAKEAILLTAKEILLKEGPGNLTTDNLIAKTGLSKGGLFYHFKTIEDLIYTLTKSMLQEMEDDVVSRAEKDSVTKGALLRGLIAYTLENRTSEHLAIGRSLMEVIFNKTRTENLTTDYEKFCKRLLNDGVDKMTAMLILHALDGCWYNDIYNFNLYPDRDIKKFLEHLKTLTYEGCYSE